MAAVHGVAKSRARLSDFTFTFHFHALEKEMATHSSVLAWRIPGMGEPGGLPSLGSHSRTRLKRLSSSNSTAAHSLTLRLYTHTFLTHTYTFLIFQPPLKGHCCYLDDPYSPFPGPETTRLSELYLSSLDA